MDFLRYLLICLTFLSFSCGKNKDILIKEASSDVDFSQFISEGGDKSSLKLNLNLSTGETRDLANDDGKPTMVIFSGEFCLTCREEHKSLISFLGERPDLLEKINLYTVFIRIKQKKSPLLKNLWGIPWDTGYDEQNDLFNQLGCTQTPCTLVHSPSKGVVYKEEGPFSINDFITWTELED